MGDALCLDSSLCDSATYFMQAAAKATRGAPILPLLTVCTGTTERVIALFDGLMAQTDC